ncbi:uncharacterized protein LOC135932076 [Gordionus sp. m RMFG-2023]|uniref:uncharacterized protein LOC135932076 n=1 Tax=Gordionus sp. m RMFG-2023 TaxID=3053472 RepID=UPI0031FBB6CF
MSRWLSDKLTILRQTINDQRYDILLLQETHLKETEVRNLLEYTLYCSSNAEHVWAGVAILIHNKLIKYVSFNPISSRICCLTLNIGYKKIHLFNIYSPHNNKVFYIELENILKELPHRDSIILAGDFNASVGKPNNSTCLGNATLVQSTNTNGKKLIEICEHFNLKIGNTFFNHPNHHTITYKSPSFGTTSQIDFFVISNNIFKWVKDIKVVSKLNFTLFTDHYPLGCELRIKNSIFPNRNQHSHLNSTHFIMRKDLAQLNDPVIKEEFITNLTTWRNTQNGMINPNITWKDMKLSLSSCMNSCLRPRIKRKEWLSPSTIQIIKNLTTNISYNQYTKHHRRYITHCIRTDKRYFIANLSRSIQYSFDNNNIYKAFQSLKLFITFKSNPLPRLHIENNKIITDPREQLAIWTDHYMNLYRTRWPKLLCDYPFQPPNRNLNRIDIINRIKRLKTHKAAGIDVIFAELWKIDAD